MDAFGGESFFFKPLYHIVPIKRTIRLLLIFNRGESRRAVCPNRRICLSVYGPCEYHHVCTRLHAAGAGYVGETAPVHAGKLFHFAM